MLLAEKANRRVRIADEKKDEYIGMGYTVKNMDGSVIKAPVDPKKKAKELEAELKEAENQIANLTEELKQAREEADAANNAKMDLLESTKAENESLKAENANLKDKLKEASEYAENADKRIMELEVEVKKAAAETAKKEPKTKTADK